MDTDKYQNLLCIKAMERQLDSAGLALGERASRTQLLLRELL